MIRLTADDAAVKRRVTGNPSGPAEDWIVVHPSNGAILAYCDTKEEAGRVRDALNDLPRHLRAAGERVA